MYLTAQHQSPPSHATHGGKLWPVQTLIGNDDKATLATLGIYPHITAEGEPTLGYTDWTLIDGEYRREPAGTPEERQAAIEAAAAAQREAYLDQLACPRVNGRRILNKYGLFDAYESAVEAARQTLTRDQLFFVDEVDVWRYRDPNVQYFAGVLGMTEEQVIAWIEEARDL